MLDNDIKEQLNEYLKLMENEVTISYFVDDSQSGKDILSLINELSSISSKIITKETTLARCPSFKIGERITFAGMPGGHEFTSLIMALLQVSGRPPKVDQLVIDEAKKINQSLNFTTYVSLSCYNCPTVVQALNTLSALNENITHTMVVGADFSKEVQEKNILAVPYVELNGEFYASGRTTIEEFLTKLGANTNKVESDTTYDILIVGGGPAGASAAIYSARKGLNTAIVSERFGGQVMDTLGIENLIGTKYTEGPTLVTNIEEQVKEYDVDIFNLQTVSSVKKNELFEVNLQSGSTLKSKTVIIATGARWRTLNIPGEKEFKNKGVAYCPHCDGPLFKGKDVAVIGGGNSGVEAAIDLAGIVSHVTLFEYSSELKADKVLQDRLMSLPNATIIKNAQTKEIHGDKKVHSFTYTDRATNVDKTLDLSGVFVQIGLVPNTDFIRDFVATTPFGEIISDKHGKTNVPGLFTAGDCSDSPYKQIIISMGSGATAALSAFDYLIRN